MSFFSTPNSTNKRCLPDPQPLSNPAKFRNLPGAYTITRPCRAGLRQNQPSVLSPPSSVLKPQPSVLKSQPSAFQGSSFGRKTGLRAKLFSFLYMCKICTHPT